MVAQFRVSSFCKSPAGLNTVYTDKIESDSRRSCLMAPVQQVVEKSECLHRAWRLLFLKYFKIYQALYAKTPRRWWRIHTCAWLFG